ncbi:unnamed protein product [Auanema sp. JU1783]|nr:unnamed protein product [Auanema sp. JU1783]
MNINEQVEREVDREYLALLERKLQALKDPNKTTAKKFLSDIATQNDHQLFQLLTSEPSSSALGFEDNFVVDQPIQPNIIQRKIAPQKCAINKQELVKLVKSDLVDICHRTTEKAAEESDEVVETDKAVEKQTKGISNYNSILYFDLQMSVKRVNKYTLSDFTPFRHSNHCLVINNPMQDKNDDVENHKLVILVSVEGSLVFLDKPNIPIHLSTLLPFKFSNGNFLEFICGDVTNDLLPNKSSLLFTFWVELSSHCVPLGYYFATFRISPQREFILVSHKVLGTSVRIAHCYYAHINDKAGVKKFCVCFTSKESKNATEPLLYEVKGDSISLYDNVPDEALSLSTFVGTPGVVIRCDVRHFNSSRWHIYGFDTGYAIITLTSFETGMKFKKQVVKFTAPVSVALILPDTKPQPSNARYVLLSSTFGPLMVWKFVYENDELNGEHIGNLELTGKYDSITCGCVMGDLVLIGTFKGKMLAYKTRNIVGGPKTQPADPQMFGKVDSFKQFNASITSLKTLNDCEAVALTTEGAQILTKYIELE